MKFPVEPDRREVKWSGEIALPTKIDRDPDSDHAMQLGFPRDFVVALLWINDGLTEFKSSPKAFEMIGNRWDTHPDKMFITKWLSAAGASDDDYVIYFAAAHVLAEWLAIPPRTMNEHRKIYGEINETAKRLIMLLGATEGGYYWGGGHGLRSAVVCDLFTDQESREVSDVVEAWNKEHPVDEWGDGRLVCKPARFCFPSLEDLLERMASAATRLHDAGPLHSQPKKRGAMNGFFIRRMDGLLRQRYGEYPAELLACIASIVLGTAIDADLVKKAVRLPERSSKKQA